MKKILNIFLKSLIPIIVSVLLVLTTKGDKGNPLAYQTGQETNVGSPFEASNTTARYALTEAIIKNRTFFLNERLARFSAPDVADYKGKYLSLFAPGVSFMVIPLYALGQSIGYPQLITFITVQIFALLNFLLVSKLASRFGASFWASILSGFIFLFATNSLSYAQTLSQHHISVSIMLACLLMAFGKKKLVNNIIFGLLFGTSIIVDIPNLFLIAPITFFYILKQVDIKKIQGRFLLSLKLSLVGLVIGMAPMISLFAFYNYQTTGSYTTLAQSIGRTNLFRENQPAHRNAEGIEAEEEPSSPTKLKLPFNPRKQLLGFYTLLISNERAWIFYSPVVFIGIAGIILAYRKKEKREIAIISTSIIGMNIILYSMFGDPWGGWAFGPRYLIPAAAVLCGVIGLVLQKYSRNVLFGIIFIILVIYSLRVNAIGAVTTTMIPPKVEAVNLPDPIPYTYKYNMQMIDKNISGSLIYNLYLFQHMTVRTFVIIYVSSLTTLVLLGYLFLIKNKKEKKIGGLIND